MQKKIDKTFSILEIKAIESLAWRTRFYDERTNVIRSQYVTKKFQELTYY